MHATKLVSMNLLHVVYDHDLSAQQAKAVNLLSDGHTL